jgi:hypothetical protein
MCEIWDMIQIWILVWIGIKMESGIWIDIKTMRSTTLFKTPNFLIYSYLEASLAHPRI